MIKISNLTFAIGAIAVLAACSDPDPRPPEEIVAERAQARWDAMAERDFQKAWEFYSPGFRQENSSDSFAVEMSRRPVRWAKAEVLDVDCDEQRCETTVEVEYSVPSAPGHLAGMEGKRKLSGVWIEIEGNWWYSKL